MADKMGLSKVKLFPRSVMRWISVRHIPVFKRRVQGGIDAYGRRFKIYTNAYMILKSSGMQRTGQKTPSGKSTKKRQGKIKAYIGIPTNKQVYPPNLTLTGLMMRNLHRKKYSKRGYTLGFTGENAAKAEGNKMQGRNIITNIPTKEKKFIARLMKKSVDRQTAKLRDVNITI